jgi:hypothetical protein
VGLVAGALLGTVGLLALGLVFGGVISVSYGFMGLIYLPIAGGIAGGIIGGLSGGILGAFI